MSRAGAILIRRARIPDEPGRQPNRWTEDPLSALADIEMALLQVLSRADLARLALWLDQYVTIEDINALPDDPFQLLIEETAEAL